MPTTTQLSLKTLAQIQAHTFIGNHASDAAAFNEIHNFVLSASNSTAEKAEALRTMLDHGMGEGRALHQSDADLVGEYLNDN
jgi:hypothetical protein